MKKKLKKIFRLSLESRLWIRGIYQGAPLTHNLYAHITLHYGATGRFRLYSRGADDYCVRFYPDCMSQEQLNDRLAAWLDGPKFICNLEDIFITIKPTGTFTSVD